MKGNINKELAQSSPKRADKGKTRRKGNNSDAYPEEFEEFRSMDLRMKPEPFGQPLKKPNRKVGKV